MFWSRVAPRAGIANEIDTLKNHPQVVRASASAVFMASVSRILGEEMGFKAAADTDQARFADGAPAPLFSYGSIEYLDGLDLSGYDLLELGGGLSTDFWSARVKSVTTLETNPQWAAQLRARNPEAKIETIQASKIAQRIRAFERTFDIIIIDADANRYQCARAAVEKLAPSGFAILDNSEWHPNASKVLRDADLIEIDFHDFKPCHFYRTTTSLYLGRQFRPVPKGDRLPALPIGGKKAENSVHDVMS